MERGGAGMKHKLLCKGDIIQQGDEWWNDRDWLPVVTFVGHLCDPRILVYPIRRPFTLAEEHAEELHSALNSLLVQIGYTHQDPEFRGVWHTYETYIGEYKGANFDKELLAAKQTMTKVDRPSVP